MDAGWYPDPSGTGTQRYWDGIQWTDHVSGAVGPPAGGPQPQMQVLPKNPAVSLIISFFLPGVGSIVNGDVIIGAAIAVGAVISALLMCVLIGFFTFPIFWIWGMIDAYIGAQRWNRKHGFIS